MKIPEGFRLLLAGDLLKAGDLYWSSKEMNWVPLQFIEMNKFYQALKGKCYIRPLGSERLHHDYFNYFFEHSEYWGVNFSAEKILRLYEKLSKEDEVWKFILEEKNGKEMSPEEMRETNPEDFESCMSYIMGTLAKLIFLESKNKT